MPIENVSPWIGLDGAGNVVAVTGDFRVVKITPDGAMFTNHALPVVRSSSLDYTQVTAAAVGPPGNVVLTGGFTGVVDFGLGDTPSTGPWFDTFVLALDP